MNKRKQQSSNAEKFPISEKWKEIINRWKDIPPIDDSIAPWPLCRGFNEESQSEQSDKNKTEQFNRTDI